MSGSAHRPHVCHVTTASGATAAGVFESIRGVVEQLGRRGQVDVSLVHAAGEPVGDESWSLPHVTRSHWRCRGPRFFCYGEDLASLVPSREPGIFHQHGLWQYHSIVAAASRRRGGVLRVASPHGMLHPWAMAERFQRKRVAWLAYERRSLAEVDVFHATAEAEAEYIRDRGLRQPIAVIPHGVDVPTAASCRRETARRTALFLSRLHPGKRVEDLLCAWGRVRPSGWDLVIAGPDHAGHRQTLESQVPGGDATIRFVGPVYGDDKRRLFGEADLFILPSLSENFGLVVAEALAHGVPVITTTGTPWKQLVQHGCGWYIPPHVDALTDALAEAVSLEAGALATRGRRGWEYARSHLTWDHVAECYEDLYAWLGGMTARPSFVQT